MKLDMYMQQIICANKYLCKKLKQQSTSSKKKKKSSKIKIISNKQKRRDGGRILDILVNWTKEKLGARLVRTKLKLLLLRKNL